MSNVKPKLCETYEGTLKYEKYQGWETDRTKEKELDFIEYTERLAAKFEGLNLAVEMVYGVSRQGLKLMIIGQAHRSRLIGVHPEDPRGLLYILGDDGMTPRLNVDYKVAVALTFTRLMEAGGLSVFHVLEIEKHSNGRLADLVFAGMTEDEENLFGPVTKAQRLLPN